MGKLIVLDGLDGCGKTTQFNLLLERLKERGVPVRAISFPDYNEPSSTLVQMYLRGEFGGSPDAVSAYAASSFYAVDRYASYRRFWEEDYRGDKVILAARYVSSNAIHQMCKLSRFKWDDFLRWLSDYEYEKLGLPRPDRVIFLDMLPSISQELLSGRYGGDESQKDIHEADAVYLSLCREAALYAAKAEGWRVVPCSVRSVLRTREEIAADIDAAIDGIL